MKCGVITPIGPGHRTLFEDRCLPSVERAVAYSKGPFEEITLYRMDDGEGRHGRSNRRNAAIRQAAEEGVDWLFFLDADDELTPNAFEAFGRVLAETPDLDAAFGLLCHFDEDGNPGLREGQPERLDSYGELIAWDPFVALEMGHFVRTEAAAQIGFDETMDTGEDYTYYYALWQRFRCVKRPEIFYVIRRFQSSSGPRSASGSDWSAVVGRLWAEQVAAHPLWAEVSDAGIPARMRVTNPRDLIQAEHLAGRFFEAGSLARLKTLVPEGARIVEVGANVGNHVVWYAQHLAPEVILPVEPNPEAIAILDANIAENRLEGVVDRRGIGLGAGRAQGRFRAVLDDRDNLGATRLVEDPGGGLTVVALDDLVGEERVDFIKIDAEGMELDVLDGASALIARERPVIWVEARRENIVPFAQGWCRRNDYCIADSVAYVNTMDYFVLPMERA
ncbi:FkbM family methyltransferase [Solirhodobacter olei]|uniref:FkbM family methyltransferase n=1 Tax=Solirhodobacter olei TaxID=2493082 RepID=UPI000FD986F5|nr:FkbM family methyltransferase [Solirhodobacter olei]